jgi:DNA polymerase, archaea type
MIKYIVAEGAGRIRDKAKIPGEVNEGKYDAEYYVNNQVIPAVEKILEVLGYDKDELIASDQSKLGAFFK